MDVLGHIVLGAAVSGEVTPYTVALSLLPDIGALPLQYKQGWKNPRPWMLTVYKLFHSPVMLLIAYYLPGPAFLIICTHIISDMFTHKEPYSDFPLYQWGYNSLIYYYILSILVWISCVRLYF